LTELVFRDQPYLKSCTARVLAADDRTVMLDRTVFYAMSGGQAGDTGRLILPDGGIVRIADTIKGGGPDDVIHVLAPGMPVLAPGTAVIAQIDWDRRYRLMRMHTCLHLLSAVLPYSVTGGQVADGKGRLDFDLPGEVPSKEAIGARVNELIQGDHAVQARWIDVHELAANPDLVKTMSVKPPTNLGRVRLIEIEGVERPLDLQACGGTHVARTGEIGPVVVRKIENKGRQNRRVIMEFTT
jgi:misacylated tRNA(Ala) deacylase